MTMKKQKNKTRQSACQEHPRMDAEQHDDESKTNRGRKLEQKWRVTTNSYSPLCREELMIYIAGGFIFGSRLCTEPYISNSGRCETNLIPH
jgi:hypothetical protein